MLFVNARKKFDEADYVSETGLDYFEVKYPKKIKRKKKEYTVNNITKTNISQDDFYQDLESANNKRILILMHGYNTTYESVFKAYHQIEHYMDDAGIDSDEYGAVIGFLWASCDRALEWWKAERAANRSAPHFLQLLLSLHKRGYTIDLMTHSLGARVSLLALQNFYSEDADKKCLRNYFLTAGAIDHDSLEPQNEFSFSLRNMEKLFILHSKHDGVMSVAYKLSQPLDFALGYKGPASLDDINADHVYKIDCQEVIRSHGEYSSEEKIFEFMKSVLNGTFTAREHSIED